LKYNTFDEEKRLEMRVEIIFIIWIKKLVMTRRQFSMTSKSYVMARTKVSVARKLYVMASAGHKTTDQS